MIDLHDNDLEGAGLPWPSRGGIVAPNAVEMTKRTQFSADRADSEFESTFTRWRFVLVFATSPRPENTSTKRERVYLLGNGLSRSPFLRTDRTEKKRVAPKPASLLVESAREVVSLSSCPFSQRPRTFGDEEAH